MEEWAEEILEAGECFDHAFSFEDSFLSTTSDNRYKIRDAMMHDKIGLKKLSYYPC